MAVLDIEGKTVEVDDAFLKLSPEEQQRTVEEIAGQMGLSPAGEEAKPEPAPQGDGLALNTTAGVNQALYNTLGAPVDLSRWLINKGIEGANYVAGSDMRTIPSDSFYVWAAGAVPWRVQRCASSTATRSNWMAR